LTINDPTQTQINKFQSPHLQNSYNSYDDRPIVSKGTYSIPNEASSEYIELEDDFSEKEVASADQSHLNKVLEGVNKFLTQEISQRISREVSQSELPQLQQNQD